VLRGRTITEVVAMEAADIVAADIEPLSDIRGTANFRRDMVRVACRRTIAGLFGLPGGNI
jgi:carbon-monoxide dehydrogenase medium subunit